MRTIIIRGCEPDDDLMAVIDLIIMTDDYIYPPMFRRCPEEQYRFFKACICDEKSAFYYKNILLALDGKRVVGLLVAFQGKTALASNLSFPDYLSATDISYCNTHYFQPLFEEYAKKPNVICISNVCIHPDYRGRHIGQRLLNDFLSTVSNTVELDVLCNNPPALQLYKNCGFTILYSEEAFAFDPIPDFRSYRMQRSGN